MMFLGDGGCRAPLSVRLPVFISACPPKVWGAVFEQDVYTNCEARAHRGLFCSDGFWSDRFWSDGLLGEGLRL